MTEAYAWFIALLVSAVIHVGLLAAVPDLFERVRPDPQASIELTTGAAAVIPDGVVPVADSQPLTPVQAAEPVMVRLVESGVVTLSSSSASVPVVHITRTAEQGSDEVVEVAAASDSSVVAASAVSEAAMVSVEAVAVPFTPVQAAEPVMVPLVETGVVTLSSSSASVPVVHITRTAEQGSDEVVEVAAASDSSVVAASAVSEAAVVSAEAVTVSEFSGPTGVAAGPVDTVVEVAAAAADDFSAAHETGGSAPAPLAPSSGTSVAALVPPAATPDVKEPADRRLAISAFLEGVWFDACFLAVPEEIGSGHARVKAFAQEVSQLASFQHNFVETTGAELTLEERVISQGQCATLEFIGALYRRGAQGVTLRLSGADVESGDNLIAVLSGLTLPFLSLVIVDDEGMATDVSAYAVRSGAGVELRAPVHLRTGGEGQTQLLIALSSEKPIASLAFLDRLPAKDLLPQALLEAHTQQMKTATAVAEFWVR